MLYCTHEARASAIGKITELCVKIGTIRGDELSYTDARAVTDYLQMLKAEIEQEDKRTAGIERR